MKPKTQATSSLLLGIFLALAAGVKPGWADPDRTYEKLDVFAQVLHHVQNGYVEQVDDQRLLYDAIRGMLKALDPHTAFMTPEEFKSMQEDTSGRFGGVGIELLVREGALIVVAPIDDTPAARAGILPGDRIVKIDGVATENMDYLEASRRIKGVPGTKLVLTIDRDDFEKPKDFVLIRQRILLNPIEKSMPLPGLGLVKIRSFQERTERYLVEALRELKAKSGGKLTGLVLDLRNNPGGLLDQAIRVADHFIAEGVIVETKGRGMKIEKDFAHKQDTEPSYPMICLINGGSASASEIVAGALQDHGRAVIMGTRSFGKGSVQTVIGLKDGSGLKLTIARYYTPKHRSIQELGIIPDVVVAPEPSEAGTQVAREEDLADRPGKGAAKVETDTGKLLEQIEDNQLRTALSYLKTQERTGKMPRSPKDGGAPAPSKQP